MGPLATRIGLPFARRIARRAPSLIPAPFVPVPFAASRIGPTRLRTRQDFSDHDLTAALQSGELGLPFAQRIARRAVSLIPAPFVLVPFAASQIRPARLRRRERFGDHDLTAALQSGELGLPFARRIVGRAASLIPAPFVPASFARVPDRRSAPPSRQWFGNQT
jgi:hypothetical protein